MESENEVPCSDILRLISMIPPPERSRLIAMLYAMDDAKYVKTEIYADEFRYILKFKIDLREK